MDITHYFIIILEVELEIEVFYNNQRVNTLLDEARKEPLKEKRKEKYEEIQEIILDENPIIPIVYKTYNIGINKNIKGFKFNPNGNHILENIEY